MTRFADYRAALHALLQARTSLSAAQVNYSRPKLSESDRRIYIDDVMTGEIETQQVLSGTLHLTETVTFVVVVVAHGSDQTQAELDQTVVAGIGNLIADEVASAARVAPRTPIGDVDIGVVARAIEATVDLLDRQGGSHTGDLGPARRHVGAVCPIDGAELAHDTVAGRSTYWCPQHQGGT